MTINHVYNDNGKDEFQLKFKSKNNFSYYT